ncbi:MAG: UpxY family transcription antiterminator [Bacteroidia bacterium]
MPLENPHYQWYVIYTRANSEKKLFNNLTQKGIECYLPTRKIKNSRIDSSKWNEQPLFRCYLFVKVSYLEFFTALNTPGVICFISSGGKAQAIPEIQIINIKTFLAQNDYEISISYEQIAKGKSIEISNGVLTGIKGEIITMNEKMILMTRIDSLKCCLYTNLSEGEAFVLQRLPSSKEYKSVRTYTVESN